MEKRNSEILNLFLTHIKEKYSDDIALVCCYGSYVNGTANPMSDLDFYYVPTQCNFNKLNIAFIYSGIGYDFWSMSWERLEKISEFDDMLVSLITEAQVVYSQSAEDEERFCQLQAKVAASSKATPNSAMLSKAHLQLDRAKRCYFDLQAAKNTGLARRASGNILLAISNSLLLANNKFLKFGIKKHLEELLTLKFLPERFKDNYLDIIKSKDIKAISTASFYLIGSTEKLLDNLQHNIAHEPRNIGDLCGLYEELSSLWNKIYFNCDMGNYKAAFIAGVTLQSEMDAFCQSYAQPTIKFLDSFQYNDLSTYKKRARQAEEQFINYLNKFNIPILRCESIEDLQKAISRID